MLNAHMMGYVHGSGVDMRPDGAGTASYQRT